jgi:hypothetical protein
MVGSFESIYIFFVNNVVLMEDSAMFEERKVFLGLINYIPKFSPPMGNSNTNLDLRHIIFFILLINQSIQKYSEIQHVSCVQMKTCELSRR